MSVRSGRVVLRRRSLGGMFAGVLIGGPLDGLSLPTRSVARGPWLWAEAGTGIGVRNGGPVRVFAMPAPGRELYRLDEVRGRREVFVYAGHTHTVCACCNGLNAKSASSRCQVCGGALLVGGSDETG